MANDLHGTGDTDIGQPAASCPVVPRRAPTDYDAPHIPEISRQERDKMITARKSHSERSIVAHYKDPSKPAYTVYDLIVMGWIPEVMVETYRDFQLGKCGHGCGRYAIDIPAREISIDIIDPEEPPVWGVNTQWMCTRDNSRKRDKTHKQRVQEAFAQRRQAAKPVIQASAWPDPTGPPLADTPPVPVQVDQCVSIKWKLHMRTKTNQARTLKPSTWRCVLEAGHDGPHRARKSAHQAPWFDNEAP